MNGEVCCILGVCCPPGSEEQAAALATELEQDGTCADRTEALKVARWVLKHFDLAPAGSLSSFKTSITKMAQQGRGK